MKVKKIVQKLLVVKIQLKLTANLLEKDDIRSLFYERDFVVNFSGGLLN